MHQLCHLWNRKTHLVKLFFMFKYLSRLIIEHNLSTIYNKNTACILCHILHAV